MNYESFGRQVRQARRRAHLTQAELAEKIGMSLSFVGHVERGTRSVSIDTLLALCYVLSTSPDALLCDSMPFLPETLSPFTVLATPHAEPDDQADSPDSDPEAEDAPEASPDSGAEPIPESPADRAPQAAKPARKPRAARAAKKEQGAKPGRKALSAQAEQAAPANPGV